MQNIEFNYPVYCWDIDACFDQHTKQGNRNVSLISLWAMKYKSVVEAAKKGHRGWFKDYLLEDEVRASLLLDTYAKNNVSIVGRKCFRGSIYTKPLIVKTSKGRNFTSEFLKSLKRDTFEPDNQPY